MKVSKKHFDELVDDSYLYVPRPQTRGFKRRKMLVGLAAHVALSQESPTYESVLDGLNEQIKRYKGIIIQTLLTVIVTKIVELIIAWIQDEMKKQKLMTATGEDVYELPELL